MQDLGGFSSSTRLKRNILWKSFATFWNKNNIEVLFPFSFQFFEGNTIDEQHLISRLRI